MLCSSASSEIRYIFTLGPQMSTSTVCFMFVALSLWSVNTLQEGENIIIFKGSSKSDVCLEPGPTFSLTQLKREEEATTTVVCKY